VGRVPFVVVVGQGSVVVRNHSLSEYIRNDKEKVFLFLKSPSLLSPLEIPPKRPWNTQGAS